MYNTTKLHESGKYYEITIQGKQLQFARLSDVIESTHPTPYGLKKWTVNCAVKALMGGYHISFPHEPTKEELSDAKNIAWSSHQIEQQQALDVGNKVHKSIRFNTYDESTACDESRACWKAYQSFVEQYIPCPIAQEIALYDTKNMVAGTMDWIGILKAQSGISVQINGKYKQLPKYTIYIIDWKTSKAINDNYKMQVTVYKSMIVSLLKEYKKFPGRFDESTARILNDLTLAAGPKPRIVCAIVRLSKKSNARKLFEFVEVTAKEEKEYLKEFALMAKLHNLRKQKESAK